MPRPTLTLCLVLVGLGTDFVTWRNRTGVMLEALFPAGDGAASLAAWQTPGASGGSR